MNLFYWIITYLLKRGAELWFWRRVWSEQPTFHYNSQHKSPQLSRTTRNSETDHIVHGQELTCSWKVRSRLLKLAVQGDRENIQEPDCCEVTDTSCNTVLPSYKSLMINLYWRSSAVFHFPKIDTFFCPWVEIKAHFLVESVTALLQRLAQMFLFNRLVCRYMDMLQQWRSAAALYFLHSWISNTR